MIILVEFQVTESDRGGYAFAVSRKIEDEANSCSKCGRPPQKSVTFVYGNAHDQEAAKEASYSMARHAETVDDRW